MKHAVAAAALLAFLLPATAKADVWADLDTLAHSYKIDKVETAPITCHINASIFDDLMQQLPGDVAETVASGMEGFTVTVKTDGTINFQEPRIKIYAGPYDAAENLTSQLSIVVKDVRLMTRFLLEALTTTHKGEVADFKLGPTKKVDALNFSYVYPLEGGKTIQVQGVFSGDEAMVAETNEDGTTFSDEKFTKLDGQLAPDSAKGKREGAKPLDAMETIKYQKVGKVQFPASVTVDGNFGAQNKKVHLQVYYTACGMGGDMGY